MALVSFICHLYLFVMTSYLGFSCLVGMPGSQLNVDAVGQAPGGAGRMHWTGTLTSHRTNASGTKRESGAMPDFLFFFFAAFITYLVKARSLCTPAGPPPPAGRPAAPQLFTRSNPRDTRTTRRV